jgi:hypothetical protein
MKPVSFMTARARPQVLTARGAVHCPVRGAVLNCKQKGTLMRNLVFAASFVAILVSASAAHAEIFPPTFFRCGADQLFGHPSDGASAESRTGYGRTQWARIARSYWRNSQGQSAHGNRFWLSTFDTDVEDYALNLNTDLYPVYYNLATDLLWVGPGPNNATWIGNTRSQIAGIPYTGGFDLPAGVAIDALCEAGCYAPEQQIRVGDTSVAVSKAHESGERALTTLAPGATIDSVQLMQNKIARWTVDIAPAKQTIVTLRMKSGGELRVTLEHPVVTSDGVMRQAQTLVVGDSLVRDNGASDPVVSISRSDEMTKVYNLRPTTTDLTSNVLVAQGYLSGSARYQNEYLKYLNRVLFRRNIPVDTIPRGAARK